MQTIPVLVELDIEPPAGHGAAAPPVPALPAVVDPAFGFVAVPRGPSGPGAAPAAGGEGTVIRAHVEPGGVDALRAAPDVRGVWSDPPIVPFACDCTPRVAKGSAQEVAALLGAPHVWAAGVDGEGIVIAVADGGVDRTRFPVVAGWSPPGQPAWGEASAWDGHGDMCAFDCAVAAPKVRFHDLGVGKAPGDATACLSAALHAFAWALERHREDGTPQIVVCSWGLPTQSADPFPPGDPSNYTHNPDHVLVRKALELIDAGILLVFAAGNCGGRCSQASGCGEDRGPGKSIRGLNGHERIICVGAVNPLGEPIGYSSEGPATLAARKPDVCGYSHFAGHRASDCGTSAAAPTVAGALALLRAQCPTLRQDRARDVLIRTARPIDGLAHHPATGFGVVDAARAFKVLS